MRLLPSDPDIRTIITRIEKKDIDLQPDFQRGEVWSDAKKRRLIDSVLRDWHVPPIHVVEVAETARQEVLDGQQRLVAIRDFARGKLKVDGKTEPFDQAIHKLDGLTYGELPEKWRRRFEQFTIRVFKITDYLPGEPGELFFRLNQPTNLTSAEQRNAFFGPAREQVKGLVATFEGAGLTQDSIGFSNSRMAYDDVLSRLCLTLERGTLREHITAYDITEKYRTLRPFSDRAVERATSAVAAFGSAVSALSASIKLNKATLFSWLCFTAELEEPPVAPDAMKEFPRFVAKFEQERAHRAKGQDVLLNVFLDRASSRVSDVTSVLLRDLVLWLRFVQLLRAEEVPLSQANPRVAMLQDLLDEKGDKAWREMSQNINTLVNSNWGAVI